MDRESGRIRNRRFRQLKVGELLSGVDQLNIVEIQVETQHCRIGDILSRFGLW